MNNQPKVSVILPSLNVAPYIRECIESVISQTLKEIEIICVDAGSTDGTLEILEEYAAKDSRIKILHSDKKSYGYQMNMGIDAARGEYMGIVETDDYIDYNMYKTLYKTASNNLLDLIKADFKIFTEGEASRIYTYRKTSPFSDLYTKILNPQIDVRLFKANNINPIGIYCLDFIHKYNIRFNQTPGASFQDNGFWFQCFAQAEKVYLLDQPFYYVRRDNPDSSVKSTSKVFCMCEEYDYIRGILRTKPTLETRLAPLCAYFRYANYEFTLNRISAQFRLDFIRRFSQDFRCIQERKELDKNLYSQQEWNKLQSIMADPDRYYYQAYSSGFSAKNSNSSLNQVKALQKQLSKANSQIIALYASRSWRVGRFITWLPRKALLCARCYKENGFLYTAKRMLMHLHLTKASYKTKTISTTLAILPQRQSIQTVKKGYDYYKQLLPEAYPAELCEWYERVTKEKLDLNNPKTFNEKIQWLKLYDSTPLKTRLADKYLVREWVAKKIGIKYLIPLIGVWNNFDEINFAKLPEQYILKANHGSGWNIAVRNKNSFDKEKAKEKFDTWLKSNYAFKYGLELHYMNIRPQIIAEKYIAGLDGDILDYRFFCFNGKPQYVWLDNGSGTTHHKRNIYNMNWDLLHYTVNYPPITPSPKKPMAFEEMTQCAKMLCKDFAFVRIDFYYIDNHIYFGEMTFTPQSGSGKWSLPEQNRIYGDLITLPIKTSIPRREQ